MWPPADTAITIGAATASATTAVCTVDPIAWLPSPTKTCNDPGVRRRLSGR